LHAVALGHEFLAEAEIQRGYWRAGIEHADRDHAAAEKIGYQQSTAWADYLRGFSLLGLGELGGARQMLEEALRRSERIREPRLLAFANAELAMALLDLGEDVAARECAEAGRRRGDDTGQPFTQAWGRMGLIDWHLRNRHWDDALAVSAECEAFVAGSENRMGPIHWLPLIAQSYLGAQRLDEAQERAETLLLYAREAEAPQFEALAFTLLGQVAAAREAWAEAELRFNDAIAGFESLGSRLELGRALVQRGRLHRGQRRDAAAQADLQRARALFVKCGALRDLPTLESGSALAAP
jgi:hypothetical protein